MPTKIMIADGSVYIEGRGLNRWEICDDSIVSPRQDVISSVVVNHTPVALTPGIDHSVIVFYGGLTGKAAKLTVASKTDREEKKSIRILGVHRTRYVRRGHKWVPIGENVLYCADPNIQIRRVTVDGTQVYKAKKDTRCEVHVYIATSTKSHTEGKSLAVAAG